MHKTILDEIKRIEALENVEILYAVESGSRAWGFPSEDSDYDVRFIYTRPQSWYLTIEERRDVLEYPIDDLLDVSGWDLRKTLQLFRNNNPSLIEWLYSPIIYQEKGSFAEKLRTLLTDHASSKRLIYHYLHMAQGNFRQFIDRDIVPAKKYFYVLRALLVCLYIETHDTIAPILFDDLLHLEAIPHDVLAEIQALLIRKKSGDELDGEPKNIILNPFIKDRLDYFSHYVTTLPETPAVDYALLNQLFHDYLIKDL